MATLLDEQALEPSPVGGSWWLYWPLDPARDQWLPIRGKTKESKRIEIHPKQSLEVKIFLFRRSLDRTPHRWKFFLNKIYSSSVQGGAVVLTFAWVKAPTKAGTMNPGMVPTMFARPIKTPAKDQVERGILQVDQSLCCSIRSNVVYVTAMYF